MMIDDWWLNKTINKTKTIYTDYDDDKVVKKVLI